MWTFCNKSADDRPASARIPRSPRIAAMFRYLAGGELMLRRTETFFIAVLAAGTLAAACTPTRPTIEAPEAPSVTVLSVRILSISEAKANLALTLGLAKPNDFELAVDAIACEVTLDGRPAASVRSVHMEPLPAHGEGKVELAGRVDIAAIATSLMALGAQVPVTYTLKGTVTLRNGIALPFSRKGEIPVARFERALGVHP
jgi:LEA14-like dessication related protein